MPHAALRYDELYHREFYHHEVLRSIVIFICSYDRICFVPRDLISRRLKPNWPRC